jgi:hypothetical protein
VLPDSVVVAPPVVDAIAAWGIGGLAVVVAIVWTILMTRGGGSAMIAGLLVAVVMLASAAAAAGGVLARFDRVPAPMGLLIAAVFATGLGVPFTAWGRRAAAGVPLIALIGLQSFRLPLELLMHRAATLGIMPNELSFSGYNLDIVTGAGAGALLAAWWAKRRLPRGVVWIWNLWGCACLAVIAFIAIATSPMVRFFGDVPAHLNTWVLFFPYVWLPVVMVTIAIASHVMITLRLLAAGRTDRGSSWSPDSGLAPGTDRPE